MHSKSSLALKTKLNHQGSDLIAEFRSYQCDHIRLLFSPLLTNKTKAKLDGVIWGEMLMLDLLLLYFNQAAGGSIVRGLGRQKIGAICNLLGYYGVGFPIGISLMFAAKLGIVGKANCVFLKI